MKPVVIFLSVIITFTAVWAGFKFGQSQNERYNTDQSPAIRPLARSEQLIGSKRPDFSLPDLNGIQRQLSEWNNRVLVINFWATWCPPCLDEIPVFVELQDRYSDRGLQFIGVALQQPETIHDFYQEMKMNYPVLAGEQEVINIAKQFGNHIGALPYTVFIDRNEKIQFIKQGPITREKAEEVILSIL